MKNFELLATFYDFNIGFGKAFNEHVQLMPAQYFQENLSGYTAVTIDKFEKILPESSGKYRFSICRISYVN